MTEQTDTFETEVFIAWDSDGNVGLGTTVEEAFDSLNESSDNDLRRVARIALNLPEPTIEDAGSVSVRGERPPLRIVD